MLAGAGLGHHTLRSETLGEHRLAERVVDLVRAGVRKILALEPHLRAPGLRKLGRVRQRRGPAHPAAQLAREFCLEFGRMEVLLHAGFEFLERGKQGLGYVPSAERTETAAGIGILSGDLVGQQLGSHQSDS